MTNKYGGVGIGLSEKVKPRRSQICNESVEHSKLAKQTTTAKGPEIVMILLEGFSHWL